MPDAAASGGDEATTWRVRLFAGHRAGERSLRAGDCVTLFHSECEAALMYQRMTSAGLAKAAHHGRCWGAALRPCCTR